MPKLILKCHHIKPSVPSARRHIHRSVRYIASRDGVQAPAGGYLSYLSQRPHSHGLFGCTPIPSLKKLADEISQHNGVVWTPILSLKRSDAAATGLDTADGWQMLLQSKAAAFAQALQIPTEQFRWYAAFHNEEEHPHCHMVCYCADGSKGFLTEQALKTLIHHRRQRPIEIAGRMSQKIFRQTIPKFCRRTPVRQKISEQDGGKFCGRLLAKPKGVLCGALP